MSQVTVSAPGKINLTLDIIGRYPNGYHEMEMLMQTVSLADTVNIKTLPKKEICLACGDSSVPAGRENLAFRAAETFLERSGCNIGVDIFIEKRIPMAAGMAGGSADAAAVLVGLNEITGNFFSRDELCKIGLSLGADLPFCITGGTALVKGIGELVYPLAPMDECLILLYKPTQSVKTADCFARYDLLPDHCHTNTRQALKALHERDLDLLGKSLGNVLEKAAGVKEIETMRRTMLSNGALGSCMTGSGTVVYGIFDDDISARKCAENLKSFGGQTFLAKPVDHGAKAVK